MLVDNRVLLVLLDQVRDHGRVHDLSLPTLHGVPDRVHHFRRRSDVLNISTGTVLLGLSVVLGPPPTLLNWKTSEFLRVVGVTWNLWETRGPSELHPVV